MSEIDVSIIICTRNRGRMIVACLDAALKAMRNAPGVSSEIIVVDNGSTDDTRRLIEEWSSATNAPLLLGEEPKIGLANARNAGIALAKGKLLAFTDDDCRLDENYIMEAAAIAARDTSPTLRGGSVHLGDPLDYALTIKTDAEGSTWSINANIAETPNVGHAVLGCNMVVPREIVWAVGNFDPLFGAGSSIPGGEDTDYLFRTYLSGFTVEYVPNMRVYHHHERRQKIEGYTLFMNYSIGNGALYAKYIFIHSDFCRQFGLDVKGALTEILSGKNLFTEYFDFSLKKKVYFNIVGMLRYWTKWLPGRRHRQAVTAGPVRDRRLAE
jgi:glycosyltransferase involved in cell wall biosynthesis